MVTKTITITMTTAIILTARLFIMIKRKTIIANITLMLCYVNTDQDKI